MNHNVKLNLKLLQTLSDDATTVDTTKYTALVVINANESRGTVITKARYNQLADIIKALSVDVDEPGYEVSDEHGYSTLITLSEKDMMNELRNLDTEYMQGYVDFLVSKNHVVSGVFWRWLGNYSCDVSKLQYEELHEA